jgi:[ribosomal protein S5]-alanine N-acetyltransferase
VSELIIREPKISDGEAFIAAMQRSQNLHSPWVKSPQTEVEFEKYLQHSQLANQKSLLACLFSGNIVGVFNINTY